MSRNNEGKNSPKKKEAEKTSKKQTPNRDLEILAQAGYQLVKGPYVPAKGDQN
jgi:hypothetical protein